MRKIRNVAIDVCACEQMIAYNYVAANYNSDYLTDEKKIECVKLDLIRRKDGDMKKYDCNAIF